MTYIMIGEVFIGYLFLSGIKRYMYSLLICLISVCIRYGSQHEMYKVTTMVMWESGLFVLLRHVWVDL